ncbi:bifunctional dihydropteridine reductase/dihydrofolate reductase TmpR [Moorena sp. SIO3H5]|uniref:bifunctional dihydropteridine reductase/dihydrofolate reductase TmpR n=1 Tax=Moorena sp. SIO3H5 TaxID=2607834 RepID=UPI0013B7A7C8|nr:bifunctional dihydropteridine reductase/dihydrofolate reductase TmpR [Moorena sp. SIO3H5]NEO68471.1 bifunctional dihydropteridine reductase/dihydrofolate reductase TmpR [Moorena sp. SIO3H5]
MLKKALVTGSAVGIGRSIALDLASKGFDVAFHYNRSEEAAKQACEEAATHGVKAIALQADVTNPEQAKSLVEQTVEQLGGLSVVVNVVGNYLYKLTSEISTEEWHEILDSNLNCTFYITQAAIPYLKAANWGRIINFATTRAHHVTARENHAIYIIAKTGIIIYTKSIAKELAKDNIKITANVIAPGVAENSIGLEEVVPLLPMKRPATLQEMNNAVWFFINPEADYITGQVLEVSGGYQL